MNKYFRKNKVPSHNTNIKMKKGYKLTKTKMTIRSIYDPFLADAKLQGKAPSTVFGYTTVKKEILDLFGDKCIEDLTRKDFDMLRPVLRQRGITRERHGMIVVRKLLEYASEVGHKLQFYWGEIKLPGMVLNEPECLTCEEINIIRKSTEEKITDYYHERREHAYLRNRTMFETALHTGLRIGELLSLSWSDIDLDKQEIRVKNIKTKKIDIVDCVGATPFLLEYKKYRGEDNCDAVFVSGHDFGRGRQCKRMGINTAQRVMNDWKYRVGINKFCWHIIRKTYVTELLKQGLSIRDVQHLARHESPQTTMTYYVALERDDARKRNREVMSRAWLQIGNQVFTTASL